jgi:hypothetical protein
MIKRRYLAAGKAANAAAKEIEKSETATLLFTIFIVFAFVAIATGTSYMVIVLILEAIRKWG